MSEVHDESCLCHMFGSCRCGDEPHMVAPGPTTRTPPANDDGDDDLGDQSPITILVNFTLAATAVCRTARFVVRHPVQAARAAARRGGGIAYRLLIHFPC